MYKKILLTCLLTGTLAFANHLSAQGTPPASALPSVEILATDPFALEGTSEAAFTLIRNGDTNEDLTVDLSIFGTASNGVDYAEITNEVVIPTGYYAVDIQIFPFINLDTRGNKTVILKIQTSANYQIGSAHFALANIIDDVFNTPAPTVVIVDPANNSPFGYPADITITADASDPGANITSVSFYADDDFLGRVTSAPYTFTWTKARPGHHTLFARALDDLNQSSLSSAVQVTVTEVLPAVTITAPGSGQSFSARQNIPITVNATDANPGATIQSVAFFANGKNLGVVTTSPYSYTWNSPAAGLYDLQAVVTDSAGQKGYSKPVIVNVSKSSH
jgi:hypothetical protein